MSNVLELPSLWCPPTVLRAVDELGFASATGRIGGHQPGPGRTIALSVLHIGEPVFTDLAAGVETAVTEAARLIMVWRCGGHPAARKTESQR